MKKIRKVLLFTHEKYQKNQDIIKLNKFLKRKKIETELLTQTSKNIKIHERKISPDELSNFKGCFITGTAAEITPVGNIADYNFEVCDLIKNLSSSYEKLVGKN